MKKLILLTLALVNFPALAQASSACLVVQFSTTEVICDGETVKTVENASFGTATKALQELLGKGYKLVTATDGDRMPRIWTLTKE